MKMLQHIETKTNNKEKKERENNSKDWKTIIILSKETIANSLTSTSAALANKGTNERTDKQTNVSSCGHINTLFNESAFANKHPVFTCYIASSGFMGRQDGNSPQTGPQWEKNQSNAGKCK